jgi:acetylornithine/succinyldiaminopimelate/putrescine aminotransferase
MSTEARRSPLFSTYARADLAFERGEGHGYDGRSERYLDFMGGMP